MTPFATFDDLLAGARSGDRWSDDEVLLAAGLLRNFKPDDWKELQGTWARRPERWQGFAADALSDGPTAQSTPVLIDMICTGSDQVKYVACDALRAILQNQNVVLDVCEEVEMIASRLCKSASGLMQQSLTQLSQYLRVPGTKPASKGDPTTARE